MAPLPGERGGVASQRTLMASVSPPGLVNARSLLPPLSVVTINSFTFNCQQQLTPVYGKVASSTSRALIRRRAFPAVVLFCGVVYALVAVAGYLQFGNDTKGDVLLNFGSSGWRVR